ncbi:unnamed protein product [Commensalibacter communis]|nr:unnamed protein product [Commensalibacter communis]CAI3944981.1 unnamed protein product [Commensalibacter communis]
MASIGMGTVVGAQLQAKGWDLINNLVNKNTKYGLFNKDGNPFYIPVKPVFMAVDPYNTAATNVNPSESTGIAGKAYDALTGSMASFEQSLMPNTSVEAGVIDLNYSSTSNITDAPLMNGQFLPYNKVINPTEATINYTTTGTEKQRKFFENALKKAKSSFALFTLHTGELSIPFVNIVGYSVHRDQKNVQMYNISIQVREVMFRANSASLGNATAFHGTSGESGQLQETAATGSQVQSAMKKQEIAVGGSN